MSKTFVLLLAGAFLMTACGSSPTSNANSASNAIATNANVIKLDPANMPPGLSGSPLPVNGVPGIPANGGVLPVGKTPTPGIPSAEQLKKGIKPGLTPTPGIPDPATIRKSMGLPPLNINARPGANSPPPTMKGSKPTGGKPPQ